MMVHPEEGVAKDAIVALVNRTPRRDYLEIANELQFHLDFTIRLVDELVAEGRLLAEREQEA